MRSHQGSSPGHSGNFSPKPPKFSWTAVIVILIMFLTVVGMGIYQTHIK